MSPPWLPRLIQAVFYEKCEEHKSKDCTFFCIYCENPKSTCCEICAKISSSRTVHHRADGGHLQVFKATYDPGFEIEAIDKFIDVSDIKRYKINKRRIVYIRQKRTQKRSDSHDVLENSCRSCRRVLVPDGTDPPPNFCCLECKLKLELVAEPMSSEESSKPKTDVQSLRRKPRKGIPRRSPYY